MTVSTSTTDFSAKGRVLYPGSFVPMLINGKWVAAASGKTFETLNPATGGVLATIPQGGAEDIDAAVIAARTAFEGEWSKFKPYDRQELLLRVSELVERNWEELCLTDTLDMGVPITRALANKRRIVGTLRFYAGLATAIHGSTIGNSMPGEIVTQTWREPIGVVGGIIPWNVPLIACIWKVAPALAAGCTVILKPSEEASLTPLLFARLVQEAGLPDGVLNVVTGTGGEAGAALAAHPGVDKIGFTGSTATGQAIARAASVNVKRLSLELGGKSPFIICEDADLDKAVPIAAMSVFGNSGQMCYAGSRLFVARRIHERFLEKLANFANSLRVGDGTNERTQIGPLVSVRQSARVESYLETGLAEGAKLIAGGNRLKGGEYDSGCYIAPSIFGGVADDMKIAREEIFGPVISVFTFEDMEEVVQRANATPFGLAAGVFTSNLGIANKLAKRLRAGTIWINMYNGLDPAVPFGGIKMSGYGRESGVEHLDEFLSTKSIWVQTE